MFLRISMEIMQINTPQLVKDSKNSSGLQICVGLRNIFNIVHPFWASVGFLGYQMEPCAKGSSSRCMDMLLWSVLPRHARRINSNDLFGPSVNKKSWKKTSSKRSIECWSFINPRQASQRAEESLAEEPSLERFRLGEWKKNGRVFCRRRTTCLYIYP